jgi:hypothetical protein
VARSEISEPERPLSDSHYSAIGRAEPEQYRPLAQAAIEHQWTTDETEQLVPEGVLVMAACWRAGRWEYSTPIMRCRKRMIDPSMHG